MKGRWKSSHEFRRVWECPVCRRRVKTGGQVVNLACTCLAGADPPRQTWMRLIEGPSGGPGKRADSGPAEGPAGG
jgi:hypothetical protein